MYPNTQKLGDVFKVLSDKGEYEEPEIITYGVYTKNGAVCITKTTEEYYGECQKSNATHWKVSIDGLSTIHYGYPGAIPIDLEHSLLPPEVRLVLSALVLSEKPYVQVYSSE